METLTPKQLATHYAKQNGKLLLQILDEQRNPQTYCFVDLINALTIEQLCDAIKKAHLTNFGEEKRYAIFALEVYDKTVSVLFCEEMVYEILIEDIDQYILRTDGKGKELKQFLLPLMKENETQLI
jgi:hypothetical protein